MQLSHKIRGGELRDVGQVALTIYRNGDAVAVASVWDEGHSMHAVREASIVAGSPTAEYADTIIAIVQRLAWGADPTTHLSIYE